MQHNSDFKGLIDETGFFYVCVWKLWVILILDNRRRLVDSYFEARTGSEGILFKFALCRAFHSLLRTVLGGSITTGRPNRRKVGRNVKMVKISFQQVTVQKPEKENDGDKEEILMPYSHVSYSFLFMYTLLSLFCCLLWNHPLFCHVPPCKTESKMQQAFDFIWIYF